MSEYIHKSHNVSVLLYHFVYPVKYRRTVLTQKADEELKKICLEMSWRYEITFVEIGVETDHVHFLIQSIPENSPKKIIQTVKSITAKKMFERLPEVKKELWGGEFWTKGYFVSTVGKHGNEEMIRNYVKNQGKDKEAKAEYKQLYRCKQLSLF